MAKIFFDGKTKAQWLTLNPVLADGELVYETDTLLTKIGNGVDAYSDLRYASQSKGYRSLVIKINSLGADVGDPVNFTVLHNDFGKNFHIHNAATGHITLWEEDNSDAFPLNKLQVILSPLSYGLTTKFEAFTVSAQQINVMCYYSGELNQGNFQNIVFEVRVFD